MRKYLLVEDLEVPLHHQRPAVVEDAELFGLEQHPTRGDQQPADRSLLLVLPKGSVDVKRAVVLLGAMRRLVDGNRQAPAT